jgi:PAS domain S-box-containing protein
MQDRRPERALTFEMGFPILCGAFAATAAASALLGWSLGDEGLKRIYPTFVAMNPATAVSLVAAGAALIFIRLSPVLSRTLAAVAAAVAAAKLFGLALKIEPGVDQILFPNSLSGGGGPPSRMAPNTALAIGLLGLALIGAGARSARGVLLSQIAAGISAAIALFALLGYLLGMSTLYGLARFIPMAVHTALAVLVLSIGTVAARSDMGLMVILRDKGPAGVLARTTLPLAILIPVGVGLLRLAGQQAGLYGTETGIALQVLANVLVTFALLLGSIYALWRSDCLRREKEAALARSEQQYRLAEDVGQVGHWRMSLPSRELEWSHKVFDIVGLPPGDGVPAAAEVLALYHPRDRERARDAVVRALKTGEGWSFVIRLVRPDGSIRHVRSHGMTEPDEDGGVAALFGVFADVTDLEEARRAAEAATAAKATFLANMSHEVRTPLNSIIGFTDLLLDDPTLDERKRHQLGMVQKSGNLLMTIVDDILNLSKLDAGKLELHPEPFAVEALVDNSSSIIRSVAEAKGAAAYHLDRPAGLALPHRRRRAVAAGSAQPAQQCA